MSRDGAELATVPLERVVGVVVHGNVDLSSALIRELLFRRVSVVWASYRGRAVGYASSADLPNGRSRVRMATLNPDVRLMLARELIASKVANQATQLRRSSRIDVTSQVARMRAIARALPQATSVSEIFGFEGEAASIYFREFPSMITTGAAGMPVHWPGRSGRGAVDPVNVMLNIAYGLLLADVVRAVLACGLDPHDGLVHSSARNKPALALDLMEQFRPVVADSVILNALNNGEVRPSMWVDVMGSVRLKDTGRRAIIAGYERRLRQTFRHPTYRYEVSWRRAIEVQARAVLAVADGTASSYRGIRTR